MRPSEFMTITKISKQEKAHNRYNLYIDGNFFCGLYDDTILKFGIAAGDEISESKINDIRQFDEYLFGKKISMDYLSYRIRTVSEIKRKLKLKNISEGSIEKVVSHLKEMKLINDEEFARQFISEKIKNKPQGRRLLHQKLYEKGVPKEISDKILDKMLTPQTEKHLALKIYNKLKPKLTGLKPDEVRKKTFESLVRKGFDYDIINEIIREKAD